MAISLATPSRGHHHLIHADPKSALFVTGNFNETSYVSLPTTTSRVSHSTITIAAMRAVQSMESEPKFS